MNGDFIDALRAIEKEKEIPFEVLVETIESALVTAYKKNFAATGDIRVRVEFSKGGFKVFCEKTVVDKVNNPHAEISLAEAHTLNSSLKLGDVIEVEVTPKDFGRIAAQTAKQVVVQRIREAERDKIFEEFSERIGEVMTGTVQRHEQKNVFISLGKVEALLPPNEQVPTEPYKFNDRIKVYILDVRRTPKGPQVIVSRTHPSLIRRLFELEVPEIHDGVVTIKSVAREPGARSKIAVASNDEKVDPVGACVGHRGSRVQAIVNELYDEKIDIVRWDENPSKFIAEALSPAKVISVDADEETMSAFVIVPDNQLSLAIGKAGQNVRLAARLTGWRIDIKSESQVARAALTVKLPEEGKPGVEESSTEAGGVEEYVSPEEVEEKLITEEGEAAVEEEVQLEEEEPSEKAVEAVAEAIVYQGESEVEDTPQEQEPEDNEMAST
ncbi:MAG: transcription termination factor NusA [Armatimonadota bacterium]|nr:transcription termination factor NusA [Armatimonadota bacterium]